MRQIFQTKSIDRLIEQSEDPEHKLKRLLGPWSLIGLGVDIQNQLIGDISSGRFGCLHLRRVGLRFGRLLGNGAPRSQGQHGCGAQEAMDMTGLHAGDAFRVRADGQHAMAGIPAKGIIARPGSLRQTRVDRIAPRRGRPSEKALVTGITPVRPRTR